MSRHRASGEQQLHEQHDNQFARGTFLHQGLRVVVKADTGARRRRGEFFRLGLTPKHGFARSR
jgi:hypothetical protein